MGGEKKGQAFDPRATTNPEDRLERARDALRAALGDAGWHEASAVAANFNQMDRIADSTGIPSDVAIRATMAELGQELGTVNFASAKSTLQRL